MATAQIDDDAFGTYLAYSPTTDSLARTFGYLPRLSPLASTPPHLRTFPPLGVGLASIPPQQQQQPRRVAPYKGTPPTGPLLSSTPSSTPQSLRRIMVSDASPPSIGAAGVGLFSPSPAPSPPQQLGFTPRRTKPTPPPLIGAARVGLSSPSLPTSSTPRRRPTVRRQRRRRTTTTTPGTTRGSTTSSARSRVARIRHTPTTRRRVRSLQRLADHAVRGRRIAAVTETRTVTTTYKGNNHPPRVTRVSTRQRHLKNVTHTPVTLICSKDVVADG